MLIVGEAVPAHCCILSACSPFFTERLEREMPPKGHKVVLEIRGLKIGTLRKLVDFLYTSEMEVSWEEAQDILAAARQLQVSELESLQLEGGKLVKKSLGPRLNRGCLQLSSPIQETNLVQPSPVVGAGCSSLTSLMVTGKQHRATRPPCTKVTSHDNSAEQKETKKQKPAVALLSVAKQQISRDPAVTAELKTKTKKPPPGVARSALGKSERGAVHVEETSTVERLPTVNLKESKTVKLRRSKVSAALSPALSASKDHSSVMSSKPPRPSRRLWRQKSHGKDEAKDAEDKVNLPGFWSPPLLPKLNKGRKRNFSEPASSSGFPLVAEQIGRVKLRKVINGSSWEVVQESPATQLAGAANMVCPLKAEISQPHPTHPISVEGVQHSASSPRLLPAKQETVCCSEERLVNQAQSKVKLEEGDSAAGTPYDLNVFMTEHVAEGEQYDSLASAGELENLLDLLLADATAPEESKVTEVLEGTPMACPARGENKGPLESTGAEGKHGSPAEVSVSPLVVEREKNPLQRELEATDLENKRLLTCSSSSGCPLPDPVFGSSPLVTNESFSDSVSLNDWPVPEHHLSVLENGAARFTDPSLPVTLTCDEDQELLSFEIGLLGPETKPHTQAVLRSPVQHDLDYKMPCVFTSLEEEDLDVGGVEELFITSKCVWPDPSPETEVDVLS